MSRPNYNQIKARYGEVFEQFNEARIREGQKTQRIRNVQAEVRVNEQRVKDLEDQLEAATGSGEEKAIQDALREAREALADSRELKYLADRGQSLPATPGEIAYTKLQELLGGVSQEYLNAIVQKELEALPQDFMEPLLRAYSVYAGGNNDRWGQFLSDHLRLDLRVPGELKFETLKRVRREVLDSHGFHSA